ncbi:MAG TPA: sigma-70 family RNA polymerase sigma factor [Polyangiaceae bacterium]|nr:sigma-70 family RNA polymerase sigma factor [Polyangiaceae bacterium]
MAVDQVQAPRELSSALHAAYTQGRKAWPELLLSYERFQAHATQLAYTSCVVPAYPADLYLCAACASGQGAAYQALEAAYFPGLARAVFRILGEQAGTDEVLQEIRTRLFVGSAPKISSYRGSGALSGWLRSLAVNAAQDRVRSNIVQRGRLRRLATAERGSPTATTLEDSAEQPFRGDYARVCGGAWYAALATLGSAERQLLHHHFVSGLSIDVLGPLYGVHRATVHRRIRKAVERVRRQVRERLLRHYRDLSEVDLDALAFRACRDLDLGGALVRGGLQPSHAA